jgi:hypothetical protein
MKNYLLIITLLSVQLLHAQAIFQHTTTASNISNRYMTTLTHPLLDKKMDAIVLSHHIEILAIGMSVMTHIQRITVFGTMQ